MSTLVTLCKTITGALVLRQLNINIDDISTPMRKLTVHSIVKDHQILGVSDYQKGMKHGVLFCYKYGTHFYISALDVYDKVPEWADKFRFVDRNLLLSRLSQRLPWV
jgi:hypothetical protein